jgi:predicted amidophosphoribosyltransferase
MAVALGRDRATAPQYRLDRRRRADNVHDAFVVRSPHDRVVRGQWVVLVDDVVTTGATLCSAADALLSAGAVAVSAVTVARER